VPKSTKKSNPSAKALVRAREIYLDYASATPIDPGVFAVMTKVFKENFANPGSIHLLGVEVKKKLEQARADIAKILFAHPDEIIFTSGATESNNLAIRGVLEKWKGTPHIVTINIEHSSVLETCRYLEKNHLAEVTYVSVPSSGVVDPALIKKALRPNTAVVSVMYANNEIGTIQPIGEIAKAIRHFRKNKLAGNPEVLPGGVNFPVFYIDATQAVNYLPINVEKLGIDLLSFSGTKIYGPKGVGALYVKRHTPLGKILFGGDQEGGIRPGTENLAGAVGLAEALKITEGIKEKESKRLFRLQEYFIDQLQHSEVLKDVGILINGDEKKRLPNNVNITIPKIPSDLVVIELSARGIYLSEKSACKSGNKAGSYILRAIRSGDKDICRKHEGSLRFSFGRATTKSDLDYTLRALFEILRKLGKWYN